MNRDQVWQDKLVQLGSAEERELLRRLRKEDPDLADALWAKTVENNLDAIGLEEVSKELHQNLYAVAEPRHGHKNTAKKNIAWWSVLVGAAAVLMLAIVINPWQTSEPTAEEIARARQQLAVTFYYLNKAADITRRETEQSIALGVKTAMDSNSFLDVEAEEDDSI